MWAIWCLPILDLEYNNGCCRNKTENQKHWNRKDNNKCNFIYKLEYAYHFRGGLITCRNPLLAYWEIIWEHNY